MDSADLPRQMACPISLVKAMFQDREHQYWFATWGWRRSLRCTIVSVFSKSRAPMGSYQKCEDISQIVQDRRGDIWVGYADPFLNHLAYKQRFSLQWRGLCLCRHRA